MNGNLKMKKEKKLGIRKDKKAQIGIDFLAGLSFFMIGLLCLTQVIPGMFLPFQTETIDLNSVAYRTSVILVEDAGYWSDGVNEGEDWENNIDSTKRIGLAIDKTHPNELELNKLSMFGDETKISDESLSDKLGLYRIIGDSKIYYGYNIALTSLDGDVLALRGGKIPEYGDVSSMKRIVKAQTDLIYDLDWGDLKSVFPPQDDKADFNITLPESNIEMIINGMAIQLPANDPKLNNIKINGNMKTLGVDYWVWVDNGTRYFEPQSATPIRLPKMPYNASSRLKIVIDKNAFDVGMNLLEIKFVGVKIGVGIVELDNMEKVPIYKNAMLRVNIWS